MKINGYKSSELNKIGDDMEDRIDTSQLTDDDKNTIDECAKFHHEWSETDTLTYSASDTTSVHNTITVTKTGSTDIQKTYNADLFVAGICKQMLDDTLHRTVQNANSTPADKTQWEETLTDNILGDGWRSSPERAERDTVLNTTPSDKGKKALITPIYADQNIRRIACEIVNSITVSPGIVDKSSLETQIQDAFKSYNSTQPEDA